MEGMSPAVLLEALRRSGVYGSRRRAAARRSRASAGAGHVPRGAAAGNFCAGLIDKRRLWMYNPNDI